MDFNCAKKLIFTFSSESIICNSSVQTPSPILLRTDCKVTYVGQVCKFSFFSTLKWNTSICKSLKIEKYMIYNKEILWKTNSQKKKEKNPHKLSKYRSNCQNMVQKAWNTWVSRRYIFLYFLKWFITFVGVKKTLHDFFMT